MAEATDSAAQSSPLAARLLSSLRARRTYLLIYQDYRQSTPKRDFAALLDRLISDTHDVIASVSRMLRLIDQGPASAGINEKLLTQGRARRGTASKLNFMLTGCTHTLEWYDSLPVEKDPPEVQALWQELITMEKQHLEAIKQLLGLVELTAADADDEKAQGYDSNPRRPSRRSRPRRVSANPTRRRPGRR